MKRKLTILIAAVLLLAAAMLLSSCGDGAPYGDYDDEGYTVSVKFDAGGGTFAGRSDIYVVDVFHKDNDSISLLKPNDEERGGTTTRLEVSRDKHKTTGWFVSTLDESCRVIDVRSGNAVSDAVLAGTEAWDFENYRLVTNKSEEYTSATPVLVLKAGWQRYNVFNFLVKNEDGEWETVTDKKGNPDVFEGLTLDYPTQNFVFDEDGKYVSGTGDWKLGKYVVPSGKTFIAAYLDKACTIPVKADGESGKLTAEIYTEKTGITETDSMNVYLDCHDGKWYDIYTAEQFCEIADASAIYNVIADSLDFSDLDWPFDSATTFRGKIISENGCTFTGISARQTTSENRTSQGGIFYSLGASSVIRNVNFDSVSYSITGSLVSADFGLFAGYVADGATLENVSLSGSCQLIFTKKLLTGDGIWTRLLPGQAADGSTTPPTTKIYTTVGVGEAKLDTSLAEFSCALSDDWSEDEINSLALKYEIVDGLVVFTKIQNG